MQDEEKQELENFIEDWHWDEKSHKFAQDICQFTLAVGNTKRRNQMKHPKKGGVETF